MDREIPKEVRRKERNKKLIRYGIVAVAGVVVVSVLISLMRTGVKERDLVFSTVDQGTIEVSVSASGKVVPAFEEIINSPIDSRVVALGGVSLHGIPMLRDWGFGGAAFLGDVWERAGQPGFDGYLARLRSALDGLPE